MTRSGLATQVNKTSEQSARTFKPLDHIILHHAASTSFSGVVAMMMPGGRKVSAHGVVKDAQFASVVDEKMRAWSLSSPKWDSRSLTIEACNSSAGGSWPLSPKTHEMLARIVVDWSKRYGIPIDRKHVIGHREVYSRYGASYATACPGGMDLDWIVTRARELAGKGGVATPIQSGGEATSTPSGTFNGYAIRTIQSLLTAAGFKTDSDGIYGPDTRAQVKAFQRSRKLDDDGIVGPKTWAALQAVKKPTASKPKPAVQGLVVDGVWGEATTRRMQTVMLIDVDGKVGPQTIKAIQKKVGVAQDGIIGDKTRKALQRYLKVEQDGVWGPKTVTQLQKRLNAGTF
jgi:peptidoglycan hydrolase-like protein with peptidoglycan-binding domain